MIVVTELRKTCDACPSQWEGRTADGRVVYVRYRWGGLQVGFGMTIEAAVRDQEFYVVLGDELDGLLSFEQLQAATHGLVRWNARA